MLHIIRIFISFTIIGNTELARAGEAKKKARTGKWYGLLFCSFFISFSFFPLFFSCSSPVLLLSFSCLSFVFLLSFFSFVPSSFYFLCLPFFICLSLLHQTPMYLLLFLRWIDWTRWAFPKSIYVVHVHHPKKTGASNCWIDGIVYFVSLSFSWIHVGVAVIGFSWYCSYSIFGGDRDLKKPGSCHG